MASPVLRYRIVLLLAFLLYALYWGLTATPTVAQRTPFSPPSLPSVVLPEGMLAEIYETARPATVRIEGRDERFRRRPQGIGTGFFVSEGGLLLTAYHVIDGQNFLSAVTADESRYRLELIGFDAALDLALLQASARGPVPFLPLTDDEPSVGEMVVAIGNSRGDFLQPRSGTITQLRVDPSRASFVSGALELTNALAPGDSGGPVINEAGEAIGVVSYISFRPGDNLPQEMPDMPVAPLPPGGARDFASYAVPILRSSEIFQELQAGVQRDVPVVGFVSIGDYDPRLSRERPLGPLAGAIVGDVVSGSPGEEAGLLPPREVTQYNVFGQEVGERTLYDVIVAIDGTRTQNFVEVEAAIRSYRVGDTITLSVQRGDETALLELTLAPRATVRFR
ncbi:MAG: S1C family serine protease [Deinococcota bacterium]|jgi:S1-C subfamily serine protease|nr:S1C family serine protease [Deinococcota bacterium]